MYRAENVIIYVNNIKIVLVHAVRKAESTGVFEMAGVVWWLHHFAKRCAASRLLLEVDADAVMLAIARCFSDSVPMLHDIRCIRRAVAEHFISLRVSSILGAQFNVLADHLSHNRVKEARCLSANVFRRKLVLISAQ